MANDRVWLVCSTCGKRKLLAKHYPSMAIPSEGPGISQFVEEHLTDHHAMKPHLDGVAPFTVSVESSTANDAHRRN